MGVMRHIAQHAQGQHIIWQQFLIKEQGTFQGRHCQRETLANIRCMASKKVINGRVVPRAIIAVFLPMGAKPWESRNELSLKLMKICVDRELGCEVLA